MSDADDGFRFMTVLASHRIGPRMQRLRLGGTDLARFDTFANLHVRLYVSADPGSRLARPELGVDGRPHLSRHANGWAMRYYTIRKIDAEAGWLDIDFVLHADAGPACGFARKARPGDTCGISGPCGLGVKPAPRYLFAGDETALPAMARIAEALPADTQGAFLISTFEPGSQIAFPVPRNMRLKWFDRAAQDEFLASVSQAISVTQGLGDGGFIWIAAEFSDCEALRPSLRDIPKNRYMNVPYWRAVPSLEKVSK